MDESGGWFNLPGVADRAPESLRTRRNGAEPAIHVENRVRIALQRMSRLRAVGSVKKFPARVGQPALGMARSALDRHSWEG